MNIVPSSMYIILHERASAIWYTARDNIHQYACNNPFIILYIVINISSSEVLLILSRYVKIWFFHISLLYCTRKNILIFALVQYEWHSERTGIFRVLIKTSETNSKTQDILIFALVQYEWHSKRTGIFSGSYKDDRDQQKNARIYCTIFYTGLNREICITI
jgi:hypothetical protein